MQKYADYIKQIEIDSLWSGRKHIVWNLDRQINVLSGINGVGKSTILTKVVKGLSAGGEFPSHLLKGVRLKVEPEDAKWIRYDLIRGFDRPLMNYDMVAKMDATLTTELDWQLFQLQRKYLDYQVNIGNRIIEVLRADTPTPPSAPSSCRHPRSSSKTSSTTSMPTPARRSYAPRTRYASRRSARRSCPTSCRAARSRSWPSCSPCSSKTSKTMCSSWTSPR